MPKKARCYKKVDGIPIPPADGLLCPNCRFLLKHGQTGHKQAWLEYACDPNRKVSDAGAPEEASPVGRQLRQDPARTQVLSATSELRDQRTGQRKVAQWRLATPQPAAVHRHPDQPVRITFAQLAGFEFKEKKPAPAEEERDGGDPERAARRRREVRGNQLQQELRHKIRQKQDATGTTTTTRC